MDTPLQKLEIKINISDGLVCYTFYQNGVQIMDWNDLTKLEQYKICDALAQGYELFSRSFKKD